MRGGNLLQLFTVQAFTWSGRWSNLCAAIALEAFHTFCAKREFEYADRVAFFHDLVKAVPYVSLN